MVPSKLFLTTGVGEHQEKLAAFEVALRHAGIAKFNLVEVSSIFPPRCKIINDASILNDLSPGEITHCVLARASTNEPGRLLSASIGVAIPEDSQQAGYLSEVHGFGETEKESGLRAEGLAAEMLATILGVKFNPKSDFDEIKEVCELSGLIVDTTSVTQATTGEKNGLWTCVVAAGVLIP